MIHRFRLAAPLAAVLACALPAAAHAATITVDQAAAPGCANGVCKTIKDALAVAAEGDVVDVKPATTAYVEDPLTISKKNVTVSATAGTVQVTSKGTGADVFRLAAEGATLRGLVISVQENGGAAVRVSAPRTTVDSTYMVKSTKTTQDVATYLMDPALTEATATVTRSFVVHSPDRAATNTPAVAGSPEATLVMEDSIVISGLTGGSAVLLPGNDTSGGTDSGSPIGHRLTRSSLFALRSDANALEITSAPDSSRDKRAHLDSVILAAGASGAGLRATTAARNTGSTAGDITVSMVRVTTAGSLRSVVALADANGTPDLPPGSGAPAGSIAVSADRSILHGSASVRNFDSSGVFKANTARLDVTNSDTDVTSSDSSGSTVAVSGATYTPDAQLFANPAVRNYHLRKGSPAIDRGGPVGAGESDRDVDGDPRSVGLSADLGADEYVNHAPVARLKADKSEARQNEAVTFDASGSSDPDIPLGDRIARYEWTFGDGTTETTTVPTVAHTYATTGTYTATVRVVDEAGLASDVSGAVNILVKDGIAPSIRITSPKSDQKLRRHSTSRVRRKSGDRIRTTTRRKVRKLRFAGVAGDESGVSGVELSLRLVKPASAKKRSSSKKKSTSRSERRARTSAKGQCRYLDAKKHSIVGRPCGKPIFYRVSFREGVWAYRTKTRTKLRPGVYELTVRATDTTGVQGTSVVRFTVI